MPGPDPFADLVRRAYSRVRRALKGSGEGRMAPMSSQYVQIHVRDDMRPEPPSRDEED